MRQKFEGELVVEVNHKELDNLIGRLLTLNDATFSDRAQREAQKTLIKQTCRSWLDDVADDQRVYPWSLRDQAREVEKGDTGFAPPVA